MIPQLQRRVERYHEFYASGKPGDLLFVLRQGWVTKKNLYDYDFAHGGHLQMATDMRDSARAMLRANGDLDDDFIPWLLTDFGIAVNHTFVIDRPVQFAEWTSWADHPLAGPDGWARLDEVRYDPQNRWARLVREVVEWWRDQWDGSYLYNTFLHYSPLDLANALRGDELFTDFYEYPDEVHALLERCTAAIIAFEEDLRRVSGPQMHEVGVPFWGAMAPPGAVYISEDAMDLCGPNISEEWGMPYSVRLREHFGTLMIHHHMLGRPVHGLIGREARNSLVQLSNDPNCPPGMDHLTELYQASGTNALMVDCSPQQVLDHLDELEGIRAVFICGTNNLAEARAALQAVRERSNIR